MIYLVLSIAVSVGIFGVFRISGIRGVSALPLVCVNYFMATIIGAFQVFPFDLNTTPKNSLFYFAAATVGVLFILMFLLIHRSTNVVGISTTSAATKLSVIFPVSLSFFIDVNDLVFPQKILGIIVLLLSFLFIVYKKQSAHSKSDKILLPLLLFIGMGGVDSIVKASQQFLIPENSVSLFTFLVFLFAAIIGTVVLVTRGQIKQLFDKEVLLLGGALGLFNYGSLFFLIKALNLNLNKNTFFDSSRIFMMNNLGIIVISTLIGILIFQERLKPINFIGILLSVIGFCLII